MNKIKVLLVVLLAAVAGLTTGAASAQHETIQFRVKSNYAYQVQLSFYSQDRNIVWPGGGRAYTLNDSNVHTYNLTCVGGERICYGAWVTGNANKYWGVGYQNKQRCSNCCWVCNGPVSPLQVNLN